MRRTRCSSFSITARGDRKRGTSLTVKQTSLLHVDRPPFVKDNYPAWCIAWSLWRCVGVGRDCVARETSRPRRTHVRGRQWRSPLNKTSLQVNAQDARERGERVDGWGYIAVLGRFAAHPYHVKINRQLNMLVLRHKGTIGGGALLYELLAPGSQQTRATKTLRKTVYEAPHFRSSIPRPKTEPNTIQDSQCLDLGS